MESFQIGHVIKKKKKKSKNQINKLLPVNRDLMLRELKILIDLACFVSFDIK